jgi:hypothetical protein
MATWQGEAMKTPCLKPERFQYFYAEYRKLGGMLYKYREAAINGAIKED